MTPLLLGFAPSSSTLILMKLLQLLTALSIWQIKQESNSISCFNWTGNMSAGNGMSPLSK